MPDEFVMRRQSFQAIAWFWDQHQRKLLDLEPPYQRRSVWSQTFKDYFVDTILQRYPAPAIFLYEEIRPDGRATYHVVDGKQRLTTIFEFASDAFPVSPRAERTALRGKRFGELDDATKKAFWSYQFSVEYLPTDDESIINSVFDRINRNTARLTAQELRHARFSGVFMAAAEELTEWMSSQLRTGFPNIASQSRSQMKDVELVAQLLLLLEEGPRGYSSIELDEAFAKRDDEWESRDDVVERFRSTVQTLKSLTESHEGRALAKTRFRNQADFYSLFGAVAEVGTAGRKAPVERWRKRLLEFIQLVDDEEKRKVRKAANQYYAASRSASNDSGPRQARVRIIARLLSSRAEPKRPKK